MDLVNPKAITVRDLIAFAKLADGPDQAIADFAHINAPLAALPVDESEDKFQSDLEMQNGSVWRLGAASTLTLGKRRRLSEPLTLWRYMARRFRAVLRIAAGLKGRGRSPQSIPASEEDYRMIGSWRHMGKDVFMNYSDDVIDSYVLVSREVDSWLEKGRVRLGLQVNPLGRRRAEWKVQVDHPTTGVVGGLAYQLMLTVVGQEKIYWCDGCGQIYNRTIKAPRAGQENFCLDCTGIAKKRAVQRYKEKKRGEQKQHAKKTRSK